jgi:endogenous inhibitor of DNA gyrase (YacG/DUF329 family)
MQVKAWEMLEKATAAAGIPQLAHIMRNLERTVQVETAAKKEQDEAGAEVFEPEPITIKVSSTPRKYNYQCPLCADVVTRVTKSAMRCHIREHHTHISLKCPSCAFTTFSDDVMLKHSKSHS